MKTWNFKLKSNPQETSEKLESGLKSVDGFVFNINRNNDNSRTFKVRKRVLYPFYWAYQNWTIVNGKLLNIDAENETNVKISFTQHFLIRLLVFTHLFLGLVFLIAIFSGISSNASMYILGGVLLAVGVVLWFAVRKKYEKDIQNFKTLLSEILESKKG